MSLRPTKKALSGIWDSVVLILKRLVFCKVPHVRWMGVHVSFLQGAL